MDAVLALLFFSKKALRCMAQGFFIGYWYGFVWVRVPCLQPGRCTQRLGFVCFLVFVHIGCANMNSAQKPMPY